MKKNLFYLIIAIFMLVPFVVDAYELSCPQKTFRLNDTFNCQISNPDLLEYEYIDFNINNNEYIQCNTSTIDSGLKKAEDNRITGIPINDNLITIKCKVIKDVTSALNTQIVIDPFTYKFKKSDEQNEVLRSNYIKLNKKVEKTTTDGKSRDTSNDNSLLKTLSIDNLDFIFSRRITEYNFEVLYEVKNLNISYTPYNELATIEVKGNTNLNVGLNTIDIIVTSPDKLKSTYYTLYVNRLEEGKQLTTPENDASLKDLYVTNYKIEFNDNIYEYNVILNEEVNSLDIKYQTNSSLSNVQILNNNNIKNGSVVTIKVTSQDGTNENNYRILVKVKKTNQNFNTLIIIGIISVLLLLLFVMIIIRINRKK